MDVQYKKLMEKKKKIEELRMELHELLQANLDDILSPEILKVSQRLDEIIADFTDQVLKQTQSSNLNNEQLRDIRGLLRYELRFE